MSITENITLGTEYNRELEDIIQLCSLEKQVSEKGDQVINNSIISGGEKSRISIAQNLYRNPDPSQSRRATEEHRC